MKPVLNFSVEDKLFVRKQYSILKFSQSIEIAYVTVRIFRTVMSGLIYSYASVL